MQNTNNRNKNLEWFQNLAVEEQLNIFQDYAEMLKIVATNFDTILIVVTKKENFPKSEILKYLAIKINDKKLITYPKP